MDLDLLIFKIITMSLNTVKSDLGLLEKYRVALQNVETQSEISAIMAEYGYDATFIGEGMALLVKARAAYDANKREDDETLDAKMQLDNAIDLLGKNYRQHRKKARVVYLNDPHTLSLLEIDKDVPEAYLTWLETVRKFYSITSSNEAIQQKLARLKLGVNELTDGLNKVAEIEQLRAVYLREVGESQDATKAKDKAMAEIAVWMREFYSVARIALADQSQLLEALGLKVRS